MRCNETYSKENNYITTIIRITKLKKMRLCSTNAEHTRTSKDKKEYDREFIAFLVQNIARWGPNWLNFKIKVINPPPDLSWCLFMSWEEARKSY